ncbi:NACHT domain-containing protein [Actinomadura oligospora]|uniref:NACHT domain-containing protein n=1 Tax=Actinomadura oligospora TaxID=111804 RepID=UPI0004788FA3|nr:NACHT domain-containing protein [Actinomadura oligospora]
MGRVGWYTVAGLALLVTACLVAARTWAGTSAGQFDPVGAVIALASLAVSVVALGLAVRAQRHTDTDVIDAAARLAVAVRAVEAEARRQLLGGHDRTIDVEFTLQPAQAHNAARAPTKGTLEEVLAYYRRLRPRRLVITGEGGSGKTVLGIELILGLLNKRAATDPVPVRLSAAAVDTSRPPESAIGDWLAEHLVRTYRLAEATARELVAARMVLPVLDGLDEMDAVDDPGYSSRAAQTIRACNAYLDGADKGSLVLTCRIDQYEALERTREWVRDAARVEICPVRLPKAREFLIGRVSDEGRWQPVLTAMCRSGNRPLARALSTPWRLTLAATVYDQRDLATGAYLHDPAELVDPRLDSENKIRDHLLGLLIPTLAAVHRSPYPADHVHRWLGVLALYLHNNTPTATQPARTVGGRTLSGTDLVLHELWPLAGTRLPRAIPVLIVAAAWSCFAAYMLTHLPTGFSLRAQMVGVTSAWLVPPMLLPWLWKTLWPPVSKLDLPQVRPQPGRRQLISQLVVGLAAGIAVGLATGIAAGLTGGLAAGLAVGLTVGLTNENHSPAGPHEAVRSSIAGGLAAGLAFGLAAGLAFGLAAGLTAGLTVGLMTGLVTGLAAGLTSFRYMVLLLGTRRWSSQPLPWWLGRFLQWSYRAGLVRIAGTGYQFRHRELQEYLARHPTP